MYLNTIKEYNECDLSIYLMYKNIPVKCRVNGYANRTKGELFSLLKLLYFVIKALVKLISAKNFYYTIQKSWRLLFE